MVRKGSGGKGQASYLVNDADDYGVEKSDPRHAHQAEQEHVGISVELEICRLWVQDGADQLPFGSAEAWNGAWVRCTNPTPNKPTLPVQTW